MSHKRDTVRPVRQSSFPVDLHPRRTQTLDSRLALPALYKKEQLRKFSMLQYIRRWCVRGNGVDQSKQIWISPGDENHA